MANLYEQADATYNGIGSVSISYDYAANFVALAWLAYGGRSSSGVDFTVTIKLINGGFEEWLLTTDDEGRQGFYYDLSVVASVSARAQVTAADGTQIDVIYEAPTEAFEDGPLTLAGYVDDDYLIVFGRLINASGVGVGGARVDISTYNYDVEGSSAQRYATTNGQGEYRIKLLLNDGDWDIQARSDSAASRTMNIVLRREERKFVGQLSTADISARYTGFAAYPSNIPAPNGEFELLFTNMWDEKRLFVGRIVRDDGEFYFGLYPLGSSGNGDLTLPPTFILDRDNRGFISGSTLIVNDVEKYEMGSPSWYGWSCIYFDTAGADVKRLLDKYFRADVAPQSFKIEWVFRH